jgi:hypothetical protein
LTLCTCSRKTKKTPQVLTSRPKINYNK